MNTSIAAALRAFDDGRDRSEFYRMWRAGASAGLTHPAVLTTIQLRPGITAAARNHLLAGTSAGRDLAFLVRAKPQLFEPFESALLRFGEESGQLEPTLGALADFFMRQYRLIMKVRKWLSYPLFVSLVAVVSLPLPLVFQERIATYWVTTAVGLIGWFTLGGLALARLAQRYQRHACFVRARFARTLALCIGAGLPLGRAVVLAAEASGNAELLRHVKGFGERALSTQPLSVTLAGAAVITPELTAALAVAERTGDFATTLGRLADLYEDGFR